VVVVVVVVVAVMVVIMIVIVIAMAMMVMVDVMMSIMIGRNNSRAPWQVGEDRVCLRELRAIRPTIKDREFPTCAERPD
jgi:hypothetical protein